MGALIGFFDSQLFRQTFRKKLRDTLAGSDKSKSAAALPDLEVTWTFSTPDGVWIAEVNYDNILHEGEGPTQAKAIANAILRIMEHLSAIDDSAKLR